MANQFIKIYKKKFTIDDCKCNKGFPYLLQACDELSLDFGAVVELISDVDSKCDCGFMLNYRSEGNDFIRYLNKKLKSVQISPTLFENNLSRYNEINQNWKEIRKTKIMFNQFSNGKSFSYPICCILSFVIDTMNSVIDSEKGNPNRITFPLTQKTGETDCPDDYLRCPECIVRELRCY